MRAALREVAHCFPTAIISGRCRNKVQIMLELYLRASVLFFFKWKRKKQKVLQTSDQFCYVKYVCNLIVMLF